MSSITGMTLRLLPQHIRQAARWLLITLAVGYSTGLLFVAHTTDLHPKGLQERYRGNQAAQEPMLPASNPDSSTSALLPAAEPATDSTATSGITTEQEATVEEEMKFEKSYAEMLNITHTHILAMAGFFGLVAFLFALSERPSRRLKSFLIIEPFVAMLTSFGAMWLMRYLHPAFSYLLIVSSASMAICFYLMVWFALRELRNGFTN